jgi:hypothetical protein
VVRSFGGVALVPPATAPVLQPRGLPAPARADLSGLHRGLWGLPTTPWYPAGVGGFAEIVRDGWADRLGVDVRSIKVAGAIAHAITRWRLAVHPCVAEVADPHETARRLGAEMVAMPGGRPVSALVKKVLESECVLAFDR